MVHVVKIEHFVEFSPYHGRDVFKTRIILSNGETGVFVDEDCE